MRTQPSEPARPIRRSSVAGSVACNSRRILPTPPGGPQPLSAGPTEIPDPRALDPEAPDVVFIEGSLGPPVQDPPRVREDAGRRQKVLISPRGRPVDTLLPPRLCHGPSGRAKTIRICCTRGLRSTTTSSCGRSILKPPAT